MAMLDRAPSIHRQARQGAKDAEKNSEFLFGDLGVLATLALNPACPLSPCGRPNLMSFSE
jgi:hypothetical protein